MKLPAYYPILDVATVRRLGLDPMETALQMFEGGAKILQYRDKVQLTRGSLDVAMRMSGLAKHFGAMFVINDRADLAHMLHSALHLGQDDLPAQAARRVTGTQTVIGLSTHNEVQLREADLEPVDYLALGPIFGTATKENPYPVVGIDELARLRKLTSKPLVAIGGITRSNARQVLDADADSVAVIGDAIAADGNTRARTEEWLRLLSISK